MQAKLDFSATWATMVAMLRAHWDLIAAIAGVFIVVPAVLSGYLIEPPVPAEGGDINETMRVMFDWYGSVWPWMLLQALVQIIGTLAIFALLLRPAGIAVGSAIALAAAALLPYIGASILTSLGIAFGLILLVVPGIYVAIKLLFVGPVMIAEGLRNPIAAMQRSWRLTKGNSILIFLFVLVIVLTGLIAVVAVTAIAGIIFNLFLPDEAARLVNVIVSATVGALFSVVILTAYAAIYRQLTGKTQDLAAVFE